MHTFLQCGSGKIKRALITQGSYNLQVHPINIPADINAVIKMEEKKSTKTGNEGQANISLAHLFPQPKTTSICIGKNSDASSR